MINSFHNRKINIVKSSNGRGQEINPSPVILIVDDDCDNREMLKTLLEMWKFMVIEAIDGIEAIKMAEKNCPDLILMDVKMPDLDGFGLTRQIRQSAKIEKVPIVFLSGCAEKIYKQKGSAVGGNEYLTKPLDFDALEKILVKYIPAHNKF